MTYVLKSQSVCGNRKLSKSVDCPSNLLPDAPLEKLCRFVTNCNNIGPLRDGDRSLPSCYWMSGIFYYSGYCTVSRNIIKGLKQSGTNIRIYTSVPSVDISLEEANWFSRIGHCSIPLKSPAIWCGVSSGPSPGMVIHYTMSEMEDHVNEAFLDTLIHDEEIWVPTEWNRNIFLASGVKNPISVVPLGVDSSLYRPAVDESLSFSSGTNTFLFLAASVWNWRKGYDVLLKAYGRAFSSRDDVSLVLFTRTGEGKSNVHEELSKLLETCLGSNPPHVVLCTEKVPDELMYLVYSSADAFVLFPRGEGWCLPYCEAAACGIPVIGAYHGGQAAFLDASDSFLVRPDMIVPADPSMIGWSDIYKDTVFADYSENAIDEAASLMRWVYENGDQAKKIGDRFRTRVVTEYPWSVSVKKVYNRLTELKI